VATQYIKRPIGTLKQHKFISHALVGTAVSTLPETTTSGELQYFVDFYVDDFILMAMALSHEQLRHVANGLMQGMHDVFLANTQDAEDPNINEEAEKSGWSLGAPTRYTQLYV
jgi:predicted GTPase